MIISVKLLPFHESKRTVECKNLWLEFSQVVGTYANGNISNRFLIFIITQVSYSIENSTFLNEGPAICHDYGTFPSS
jgi:hypothetical protein